MRITKKVKLLYRDFRMKNWTVEDRNENIRTELKEVAKIWVKYCQILYNNTQSNDTDDRI